MADKESHIRLGSRGRRRRPRFGACHEDEVSRQRFRSLRQTLQAECPTRRPRRDRTGQRLLNLAQTTGLSRTDAAILELLVRYQTHSVFQSLVDDVLISPSRWHDVNVGGRALPLLLGHSAGAIARRLHGDAPLIRAGLVSVDEDGDMKAIDRLNRLARAPAEARSAVNRLLGDAAFEGFVDGRLEFGGGVLVEEAQQGGDGSADIGASRGGFGEQALAVRRGPDQPVLPAQAAGMALAPGQFGDVLVDLDASALVEAARMGDDVGEVAADEVGEERGRVGYFWMNRQGLPPGGASPDLAAV